MPTWGSRPRRRTRAASSTGSRGPTTAGSRSARALKDSGGAHAPAGRGGPRRGRGDARPSAGASRGRRRDGLALRRLRPRPRRGGSGRGARDREAGARDRDPRDAARGPREAGRAPRQPRRGGEGGGAPAREGRRGGPRRARRAAREVPSSPRVAREGQALPRAAARRDAGRSPQAVDVPPLAHREPLLARTARGLRRGEDGSAAAPRPAAVGLGRARSLRRRGEARRADEGREPARLPLAEGPRRPVRRGRRDRAADHLGAPRAGGRTGRRRSRRATARGRTRRVRRRRRAGRGLRRGAAAPPRARVPGRRLRSGREGGQLRSGRESGRRRGAGPLALPRGFRSDPARADALPHRRGVSEGVRRRRHVRPRGPDPALPREPGRADGVAEPRDHRRRQRVAGRHPRGPRGARESRPAFPDHPQRGEPRIRRRDERRVRRREGRIPRGPQQRHRAHARLGDGARAAPPIPRAARPRRGGDERDRQRGADRGRLCRSRRPAGLGRGVDPRPRRRDLRHPDARVLLPGDAPPHVRGSRTARRALRRRHVRGRRLQPARARRGARGALRAGRLRPPLEDGVVPPAREGTVLRALRGKPQALRGEVGRGARRAAAPRGRDAGDPRSPPRRSSARCSRGSRRSAAP